MLFLFFTFSHEESSPCYVLSNTLHETVIGPTANYWQCYLTKNVKTLMSQPNGPDFVAIRRIMRVCERAYVRVGSRFAPGVRVSLHPLDQYSVQWRSTVSFSRN